MKTTFESLNGVRYRTGIILTDGKEEEAPVDTALVSFFLFNTEEPRNSAFQGTD